MTPVEKEMLGSEEWQRFLTAKDWIEKWFASCLKKGVDPMQHKMYKDHQKRFQAVIDEVEKKWQQIKQKHEQEKS